MIYSQLSGTVITILTEVWIFYFYCKEHTGRFERMLWAVPSAQLILYLLLFEDETAYAEYTEVFSLVFFAIMVGVNIAVCIFLKERKRMTERKRELSVFYQQRQKELDYYQNVSEQLRRMSVVRHEFANQLAVIYDMLDKDVDARCLENMVRQIEQNLKVIAEEDETE